MSYDFVELDERVRVRCFVCFMRGYNDDLIQIKDWRNERNGHSTITWDLFVQPCERCEKELKHENTQQ